NHELLATQGVARAHGSVGAFVSEWFIRKSDLAVLSGQDLMQQVFGWDVATQFSNTTPGTFVFPRFCSGDLPAAPAYFYAPTPGNRNSGDEVGTTFRIYMHGEESGPTGSQLGTVVTGPDAGKAYILGKFDLTTNGSGLTGIGNWENALANPLPQAKTVVV